MAKILDIAAHNSQDDEVLRETKLRVWWSLYMIDSWSSAGSGLPREITRNYHDHDVTPLPMEEVHFASLGLSTSARKFGRPGTPLRPGLWGYMIQLAAIFGRVQDLHRHHVNHDTPELDAETMTKNISQDLDSFVTNLPPGTRLSEENATYYVGLGLGSAFVALHLGLHHYSTLLYFHYLDLQLDQSPAVRIFASKCRYHAAAFSDLLELSQRVPGCDAVYLIVAHMTVVSSAALLHTLLFGEHSELQKTRERLKFNFETLVRLRKYWPAVDHLVSVFSPLFCGVTRSCLPLG